MHKFTRKQLFEIRHDLSTCPHSHTQNTDPTWDDRLGNHLSESAYDNTLLTELIFRSIACFYCHPAHDLLIDPVSNDYSVSW